MNLKKAFDLIVSECQESVDKMCIEFSKKIIVHDHLNGVLQGILEFQKILMNDSASEIQFRRLTVDGTLCRYYWDPEGPDHFMRAARITRISTRFPSRLIKVKDDVVEIHVNRQRR